MWDLHRITASFRHVHLLQCEVLHGLQGDNLCHQGLHHGLQENLYSGSWRNSSCSLFTDFGICRTLPLKFYQSFCTAFFSPFQICHHGGTISTVNRLTSDQQQIRLRAGWNWQHPTRGHLVSPCRTHPCSPCLHSQLTKTYHINRIQQQLAAGQRKRNSEREPQMGGGEGRNSDGLQAKDEGGRGNQTERDGENTNNSDGPTGQRGRN